MGGDLRTRLCPTFEVLAVRKSVSPHSMKDTLPTCLSSIVGLLLRCGPPAVVWLVIAVVVAAINGMPTGWALPHVHEKSYKVISPACADFDAPSSVLSIIGSPDVVTSVFHPFPCVIFDGRAQSVCAVRFFNALHVVAAARKHSLTNGVEAHDCSPTAFAGTFPVSVFFSGLYEPEHGQPTELPTSDVDSLPCSESKILPHFHFRKGN